MADLKTGVTTAPRSPVAEPKEEPPSIRHSLGWSLDKFLCGVPCEGPPQNIVSTHHEDHRENPPHIHCVVCAAIWARLSYWDKRALNARWDEQGLG